MADWQNVLLDGPPSLDVVAAFVAGLLEVPPTVADDGVEFTVPGASVGVWPADYVDEAGLDLERFTYVIDVRGEDETLWARRVYDALVAATGWSLLWLDRWRVAETRLVPAPA